jgi:hypothetical protein
MRVLRLFVFCVFAATLAHAEMILTYTGVTAAGSSLAGNPIGLGTPFEIDALFPATLTPVIPGIAFTSADSIAIEVGGAGYSASGGFVKLIDISFGYYSAALIIDGNSFSPAYGTATPAFVALNPTPTVFSDFLKFDASSESSLSFDTSAGSLVVTYDPSTSIDTSISNVPEPGAFALAAAALAAIALRLAVRVAPRGLAALNL